MSFIVEKNSAENEKEICLLYADFYLIFEMKYRNSEALLSTIYYLLPFNESLEKVRKRNDFVDKALQCRDQAIIETVI